MQRDSESIVFIIRNGWTGALTVKQKEAGLRGAGVTERAANEYVAQQSPLFDKKQKSLAYNNLQTYIK